MALHPAPTLRACVREGLKTWRKCNAAMVLATQTVEDFASAETSEPRMQTAVPTAVGARVPERTEAISPGGPLHRLLEGTLIDTVLTNPLDGSGTAPVNCLVTNAVYSHIGRRVVIPAGARVLGTTRPVRTLGETRLAVTFHGLLMPDGRAYRLDDFNGLNQMGDAGLRGKVNHTTWRRSLRRLTGRSRRRARPSLARPRGARADAGSEHIHDRGVVRGCGPSG